jgi:hypothetical protein
MAVDTTRAKVVQVVTMTPQQLSHLGARYRGADPLTGRPLYKTAAGVVLRLAGENTVEVLSNCVC